jgi:hypothetical protein
MADGMMRNGSTRLPGEYHRVHLTHDPARAQVWRVIAEHLAPWVPSDAHVLELGAGYCGWINAVRAARKVAVDAWPEFATHAAADVQTLVMDAATGLGSLGASRFESIVADVAALLRPAGRFLIVQPNFRYAFRRYFDDYTHRSIFTDVSLANLLRAHGFSIDAVHPRYLPYSMRGRRLPVPSWIVRAYLRSPVRPWAGQMLIVGRRR